MQIRINSIFLYNRVMEDFFNFSKRFSTAQPTTASVRTVNVRLIKLVFVAQKGGEIRLI